MKFLYSWRWFGPNDRIRLGEIRQAGASHVVTALHQIPVGDVWPVDAILERKLMIEAEGLKWTVVESLPVSEDIKRRSGAYERHLENYQTSLKNLSECGIKTVCYNFMPVLDWSRTRLRLTFEDGSYTSGFKLHEFAAFDLFVLKRDRASEDYPEDVVEQAGIFFEQLDTAGVKALQDTVLYGLPGSMQTYSPDEFRGLLNAYDAIDRPVLRSNLKAFLEAIIPVAEACDIRMAIHPDDPPWNLLGLPRIAGSLDDLLEIVQMVPSSSNGITLCSGSLGAGHFNDIPGIIAAIGPAIHFVHLRNVVRDAGLNFQEDNFFDGDIDMIAAVKALILEGTRREQESCQEWSVPIRPDHGHQILDDVGRENYPGYSLYGRMKNLAEIKGLTLGLLYLNK
ncbi:MAG: mannonate dehydratase [Pontiellaceae bacterium]|nr:mannonate dehydratase [Pontiellaceae bacterium]MBN2786511.1 mannonate dehydratase [Pontiellaceae bacterium]